MGTQSELERTVEQVEALDRRIVARVVDVRDLTGLVAMPDEAVAQLGRLDIVCANAGICTVQAWDDVTPEVWQDTLDTNLTGAWNTIVAAVPHLIDAGGGSIICIGSSAGVKGFPFYAPYVASEHGLVGVTQAMAKELARHDIRVNVVHPTGVDTPMAAGMGGLASLISADPHMGPLFVNTFRWTRLRHETSAMPFSSSPLTRHAS